MVQKKLSHHSINHMFFSAKRSGTSLVELIVVLGISSLMVGGAFAWFASQRVSEFYNQMRQIESEISLAQSSINTSELVGDNAGCHSSGRAGCPIGNGQQVFASLVSVNSTAGGEKQMTIDYLRAKTDPDTHRIQSSGIGSTNQARTISFIDQVKYVGSRTVTGTCAQSYNDWTRVGLTGVPTPGPDSIAFRHDPNTMNHFAGAAPSTYLEWGGDDPSSKFGIIPSFSSLPCAVMWEFESEEQVGSNPRFTAEIVFDIRNRSIKLQTR